jgi:hypothetical protein
MKTKLFLTSWLLLAALLPVGGQNSLWINDPDISWNWQSGKIAEASLSVHPKGLYLEYGLYLTFSASETYFDPGRQLEAVLDFQLPKGALVLDNWLWVGTNIIQGMLIDRWSASDIYEGIVDRRRDPSVLFKNSDTQYQLRVYPMKKDETRKVKITYLMPVGMSTGKIEAGIPASLLLASSQIPDLNVLLWEENGFSNPSFSSDIPFESRTDSAFGQYKRALVPSFSLIQQPVLYLDAPVQNGIYLGVFEDRNTSYYQLALSPGTFIDQAEHEKIMVILDYEAGNSSFTKASLVGGMKQRLLASYGPGDSFNLMYSKLSVEQAFDTWMPVTPENVDLAFDLLVNASMYSNLPGLFSAAFEFLGATGGQGAVVLVSNSDNFGNYEQANELIRDLKKIQDPLPPIHIADMQDQRFNYYYIGNRYYYGQEYLYINLSKASGGYYKSIREMQTLQALLSGVMSSVAGMVTAFDMYTAPADGFCYGRFDGEDLQGFPVNRTITQIGKYIGQTPFMIYLTGIYQSRPFSQLIHVEADQIQPADSMLSKMWHGRYIDVLENAGSDNMIIQEILYESLNNRVLSRYSAFLCLEPSDTVSVCHTCKDESELVGITDRMPVDSTGFIKLFPNPFSDRLTIEVTPGQLTGGDKVDVRIFNLTGQLIFEKTVEAVPGQTVTVEWHGTSISGDVVPAGQYIVMVRAGQMVLSRKVMKTE